VDRGSIQDASLSPDGEWVACLVSESTGRAAIWIAPIGGEAVSERQNILVVEDDRYLSPPAWSPNGLYLYFLSQKNDRWGIFAQKLDSQTREPVEEAHEVYYSPDSKFHLNYPLGNGMVDVAADKIIFWVSEMVGNIYIAKPKSR
jgi:Tol biopolymer transport system component